MFYRYIKGHGHFFAFDRAWLNWLIAAAKRNSPGSSTPRLRRRDFRKRRAKENRMVVEPPPIRTFLSPPHRP